MTSNLKGRNPSARTLKPFFILFQWHYKQFLEQGRDLKLNFIKFSTKC